MSNGLTLWAEREVQIVKDFWSKKEDPTEGEYSIKCAEKALELYKQLCSQGHSGESVSQTVAILNRMVETMPLSKITEDEKEWNLVSDKTEEGTNIYNSEGKLVSERKEICLYQSARMSSLFKNITKEGKVYYNDFNRYVCIDINTRNTFGSKLVEEILDGIYPIKMPYYPTREKYKIFCEDFDSIKAEVGTWDTKAVLYLITPKYERIEINRFFKDENYKLVEITSEEFNDRKQRYMKILEELKRQKYIKKNESRA